MTRTRAHTFFIHGAYVIIDVALIAASFLAVFSLTRRALPFELSWQGFTGEQNVFKLLFVVWVFVIVSLNQMSGLYRTQRELVETLEVAKVIKNVFFSAVIVIVLAYVLKLGSFPRSVWIGATIAIVFSLSLWRVVKKIFVDHLVRRGYNNFNAIIIGAGKVGLELAHQIQQNPGLGVKLIGFLEDAAVKPSLGANVLGSITDFGLIAKREFIHQVYITVYHDNDMFIQLLNQARDHNIAVRVVPQGYEYISSDMNRFKIGSLPILEYSRVDNRHLPPSKRIMDFFLALIATIISLPIVVLIIIAIYIDNPGPVFYASKRYGYRGRIFNMLKFRSMVCHADKILPQLRANNEVDGPIFKMKKDPRITKFGALLRKYSLDELPQIYNVLLGDMSLVGPRPLPIDQIEKEDLRQLKRLDIRPGITGLWQVRGRSDVSFRRLLRWDIWYITNWSLWLDLYIILQTVPVVIKGKGAY